MSHETAPAPTQDKALAHRKGVLEALVGLSILVSLAGVVMPIVGGEMAGTRSEQAVLEMQRIANGLHAYTDDTLFLPTGIQGRTNLAWLYGPGQLPQANPFAAGGEARALSDVLLADTLGGAGWSGPYVSALEPDPWGNAYLVNVDGLIDTRETAMILSAGPNGIVETRPTDSRAAGDDILLPLR